MKLIYNISIWIYIKAIQTSTFFNSKAKLFIQGRKDIFKHLKKLQSQNNIVWFHCASLGEFEQGNPVIKAYKSKYPKHKILITFFSPSGFEFEQKTSLADWIFYLPADTESNAKKFVKIVNPIKVFFIKNEFWFNYMRELKKTNIPTYSVSSLFRAKQIFFKSKWFAKQLKNMDHFFVQDESSKRLLNSIDLYNITIIGDTRFDNVFEKSQSPKNINLIKRFSESKKTIICGSTWPRDEKILIKYINNHPKNNYIIAPHELYNVIKLSKKTNGVLYSKANKQNISNTNTLIIDNIGLLSSIYQYGDLAYIGGGFGSGLHNILEAVSFGLPVIFGPKYKNFNEAKSLINRKGALSIKNYQGLISAINTFKKFDSSIAHNYIKENCVGQQNIRYIIDK